MQKLSAIIPTIKGREDMLKRLLSTLPNYCQRIIMDDEKMLLAEKRNKGAMQAVGRYFLFVDDDNYFEHDAVERAIRCFSEGVGVVGIMACYDDKKDTIADGGSDRNMLTGFMRGINTNFKRIQIVGPYEVDEVANAFIIPGHIFYEVMGFDEKNFPIDLDEADICRRIKDKGYKVVMCPEAVCYHKSQTYSIIPDFRRPRNAYFMGRNRQLFQRKHLSLMQFVIYILVFMPFFVISYCLCLLYRRKIAMIGHFLKGVIDGLSGRLKNTYQ